MNPLSYTEPNLDATQLGIVDDALREILESAIPEFQWLFILVGFIRGRYLGLRASDSRSVVPFTPLVHHFARRAVLELPEHGGFIDWRDHDAVDLEFSKAWRARKQVQGSSYLRLAVEHSVRDWLALGGKHNSWVVRVVNTAFCLQEMQPESPFLIPVSDHTASLFGTSLRTLSLALAEAITLKFVKVVGDAASTPTGRLARRLSFNYSHPEVKPHLRDSQARLKKDLTNNSSA